MGHCDRSRSPAGQSEWISRSIAAFGRYPQKAPPGLQVDGEGTFKLDSLMDTWGKKHGLSEQDVLGAVQKHMFHESSKGPGGGLLRFILGNDSQQNITIRVNKRRGGGWCAPQSQPPQGGAAVATPVRAAVQGRGTVLKSAQAVKSSWQQGGGAQAANSWHQPGAQQQSADSWQQQQQPQQGGASWQRHSSWQQSSSWQQHGGSGAWQWHHEKPWQQQQQQQQRHGRSRPPSGAAGDGGGRDSEKIQRWIAFVLLGGHKDLGVPVEGGWATLGDMAASVASNRPEFGIAGEAQLRDFLLETDTLGRFEVSDGRIRKVPKDERHPKAAAAAKSQGSAASSTGSPWCGGAGTPLEEVKKECPQPPPGEHWTKYHDEGTLWYFYDGPLGKWWCQNPKSQPQPFCDDGHGDDE